VPDGFASVPLGAALPGSAERNPSGIPSAAIIRSQSFSQFQLSFSAKPRWAPRSFGNVRSASDTALNKYEGSNEYINTRPRPQASPSLRHSVKSSNDPTFMQDTTSLSR